MKKILLPLLLLFCSVVLHAANPVEDMLERIDKGAAKKFKIELVGRPQPLNQSDAPRDFFELDQSGRRVVVRGNSWVNIATGVNWYLKHFAGIHLSWNNMTAQLPDVLPAVPHKERHETSLRLRYDFNYCTFSYSMAFWDWARWEKEIDWMALHGINMPLAVVGTECVWKNMLQKLGYNKSEINQFIAGPAFLAWWEMNNLEGWGGPNPDSWYVRQEKLQKQILKRMRQFGMSPVLPGYSGMVPHDAKQKLQLNVAETKPWNGFTRPANLLPTDPRFADIANLYYEELTRLYGKADFYSMDPFHETGDLPIDYAAAGKALMQAMKRVNPQAVWVVQGWTENPRPQMMQDLTPGSLLILDLFSECRPMFGAPSVWKREGGYGPHPWLFCMLENFGANVGLHGRISQLLNNFQLALQSPTLSGIGLTMEGSENNPIMFELMTERPWLPVDEQGQFDLKAYLKARYGHVTPHLLQAWQLLCTTIYDCPLGNNQQGPHESIFCGRPSLDNFQASSWSKMANYYDPDDTRRAALLLLEDADQHRLSNNFCYDLVDIVRQALADQARVQYQEVIAAYKSFSRKRFDAESQRFLDMLLAQDSLLGTRTEFRLGHWTQAARNCGTTDAEKDLYEWNARVQITTWGNRYCADTGGLRDYAHKEWQGLLKDFYYPRWKTYFDALRQQMASNSRPNPDLLGNGQYSNKTADELFALARPHAPEIDWYALEEPWTLQHNPYSPTPQGDPINIAKNIAKRFLGN